MIGPNRGLAALALLLTISISLKGEKSTTQPFPSQLTTIQGRDLPGDYAEVEIVDFAFSPDNAKITVGFEVREGEKDLGAWRFARFPGGSGRFRRRKGIPRTWPAAWPLFTSAPDA